MDMTNEAPQVIVCAGTGGVGKTTIAAAIGVKFALLKKRTLVLTIDPARRLAQALGLEGHLSQDVPVPDPRLDGKHPELKNKTIVPDILIQPHNASLEMTFYEGTQFPAEYRGQIFAAEHGSWNRDKRTGYGIVMAFLKDGHATGEYEDFVTGFVTPDGQVWGRPVGVAVASDGSLMVTDDGSDSIWRVSYGGK